MGIVIAIDGVVSAGKSTTARLLARHLGYRHLDTGAMYRTLTLAAQRAQVAPVADAALEALLQRIRIDLEPDGRVLLDGEEVGEAIRQPRISRAVGAYADLPLVRRAMVAQQQRLGAAGGVVAEGRDMASVVFPQAQLKVRLVADLEVRARRRHRELETKGVAITLEEVRADIRRRDQEDLERDYGASGPPAGVIEVDTTTMSIDEQVAHLAALARQRGA
ncbi:MAG: (d)CMP kinase [Candidatus Latescibacteria bacterium]|nr:(d)CMP kinase [Candidatus Latescibacterota bacterium]